MWCPRRIEHRERGASATTLIISFGAIHVLLLLPCTPRDSRSKPLRPHTAATSHRSQRKPEATQRENMRSRKETGEGQAGGKDRFEHATVRSSERPRFLPQREGAFASPSTGNPPNWPNAPLALCGKHCEVQAPLSRPPREKGRLATPMSSINALSSNWFKLCLSESL